MTTLALELGAVTGFAIGTRGHVICGQWNVGANARALCACLDEFAGAADIKWLALCSAGASKATLATEVANWARERGIIIREVERRAVRKKFTGDPDATRADMVIEAQQREFQPQGDAEAYALAIFDFALGLPLSIAEAA
jgi:hypothetical protein